MRSVLIPIVIRQMPTSNLDGPACDFCTAHVALVATYRCRPFVLALAGNTFRDSGAWEACAECVPFLEAGDRDGLLDRTLRVMRLTEEAAMTAYQRQGWRSRGLTPAQVRAEVGRLHDAFWRNRP